MTVVESKISFWEALAGRAPGQPLGPADPGLWAAVAERINPAKARPVVRAGIEERHFVSVRGAPYVMLRSPDEREPYYLRLAPEEAQLARLMDGSRTVARLVAEFTKISGRLAPNQVRRVVADLAGNRMLEELPVDAFRSLRRVQRQPWPLRFGRALLAVAQGKRMVLANVDPLVGFLYRAGGRLLFTRVAAALMATVAVLGLAAFGWLWWTGSQSVFLAGDSYVAGAAVLLGLNVVALACHELGHALATKHAGRRVPAAGFLIYFGIPSVFVDTTDVWMAGRRARLRTTAAGPAAGLVLAGASALVALAVPAAAPWCFKLSFAWYINALFNLNPFLALDGYYLLMDWLEVPNLRARGLAWVAARLRRRPPSWSMLDREGRLVALYGMLAVGWLVVAANVAYRVYVDRVDGLVVGLWRHGWWARALLVATVLLLLSPVVYVVFSWAARRLRGLRRRIAHRRIERDAPRRLDALRRSALGSLPDEKLVELASQARWVYPRSGEQLVFAGAAQPSVYVVVEGALEGRAKGDPPGTIRERVGAGGVVGVAAAVTGAPSALAWYAAGTTLLALPSAAIAAAVGQGAFGLAFGSAVEAEELFAEAPAFARLSAEDRLGLASAAVPLSLEPGAPVRLTKPDEVLVVASGSVAISDATGRGREFGRGTAIGPSGEDEPRHVGVARTAVRMFSVPAVDGLAMLLGRSPQSAGADNIDARPGQPPTFGVHPAKTYAPLAVPPGVPPTPPDSEETDHRFERRLRWSLLLVLLLALLMTGANVLIPILAWAEMPSDKARLHVARGEATAVVGGVPHQLKAGDDIYVGQNDTVRIAARSRAVMTFRGGATSVICAGTELAVGALSSAGDPPTPTARLELRRGAVLTDTASTSAAFFPLAASVKTAAGTAHNSGPAWFAVTPFGVLVSEGRVTLDGNVVEPTGEPLGCGDDGVVARPSVNESTSPTSTSPLTPSPTPSPTPSLTPSPTPSLTPTPSQTSTPRVTESTTTTTRVTRPPATTATSTRPPASPTQTPTPTPTPPTIAWDGRPSGISQLYDGRACSQLPTVVQLAVRDLSGDVVSVTIAWRGSRLVGSQLQDARDWYGTSEAKPLSGVLWVGPVGPVPYPGTWNAGGVLDVTVTAVNKQGGRATLSTRINVDPCPVIF